jgi:hypothetical protein
MATEVHLNLDCFYDTPHTAPSIVLYLVELGIER